MNNEKLISFSELVRSKGYEIKPLSKKDLESFLIKLESMIMY